MVYTLGQAANVTGKSKATLSKAIRKGIISASKAPSGAFQIDPAELHRVFPVNGTTEQNETLKNTLETETDFLIRFARLEARLEAAEKRTLDLEQDRDHWRSQAQTLALTDQRHREGFLSKLFNRTLG